MPELKPLIVCISIIDALVFTSINAKHYYDKDYKFMFLKEGSYALLRLYKDYNISINICIIRKLR